MRISLRSGRPKTWSMQNSSKEFERKIVCAKERILGDKKQKKTLKSVTGRPRNIRFEGTESGHAGGVGCLSQEENSGQLEPNRKSV